MLTGNSILIDVDAYKVSMWKQYPPGTEYVSSYIESRGSESSELTFFGLQHILSVLEQKITASDVEQANEYWTAQGQDFPLEQWKYIANTLDGKLPLRVQALPEGTRVGPKTAMVQVINTDPKCYWLTTWVETKMLRVWYPTSVATRSRRLKDLISYALEVSSDAPEEELPFKLHDFGARGVSSAESAGVGGAAHILNFAGSDTGPANWHASEFYGAPYGVCGGIPAAEHSTITSWGRENEADAYKNMVEQFPTGLVAVVSDSYDIWNATENIWGDQLKSMLQERDGMVVLRPDSGDPTTVAVEMMKILDKRFGSVVNSKGYKVLNNVRVIQGDGMEEESLAQLIVNTHSAGYSATNLAFGMGGGLLQMINRDTDSFAMKCSHIVVNGQARDVYKDPIGDKGKSSKRGRLMVTYMHDGILDTFREGDFAYWALANELKNVFIQGKITRPEKWEDVVSRAAQ